MSQRHAVGQPHLQGVVCLHCRLRKRCPRSAPKQPSILAPLKGILFVMAFHQNGRILKLGVGSCKRSANVPSPPHTADSTGSPDS